MTVQFGTETGRGAPTARIGVAPLTMRCRADGDWP